MRAVCEEIIPAVTDMRWLARGDSVFVKVACNSPNPHPAVTSPKAVRALVRFLQDRGAGKIYVGDQSGVEHVRHDALASTVLGWLDSHDVSFYDIYSPYPDHVNFWHRPFVEETWGEEAARGYEPIEPYRYGRGLEYDACISHLARLEGYRPAKIVVVKQGDAIPKELLAHLAKAEGGVLSV